MSDDSAAVAEPAGGKQPGDFELNRFHVDLSTGEVRHELTRCEDLDDVLGGCARGFKLLIDRPVKDAYDPDALRNLKRCLRAAVDLPLDAGLALERRLSRATAGPFTPVRRPRPGSGSAT